MNTFGCAAAVVCAAAILAGTEIAAETGAAHKLSISEKSCRCMTDMTRVRHFYVDNLAGDLKGTVRPAPIAIQLPSL